MVKLAKGTEEGTSFYQFDSIQKLNEIISKFNDIEAEVSEETPTGPEVVAENPDTVIQ